VSDWILVGTPPAGVSLLIGDSAFVVFRWAPDQVAAFFGRRTMPHWQLDEVDLRLCRARWVGSDGEPVDEAALDGAELLSSAGARIPLARAARLLGFESPENFVSPVAPPLSVNTKGVPADGYYSSRKGSVHLPGKSRRWMREHAREIPGARKVGRDWIVSHEAYVRWLTEQDTARCRAAVVRSPSLEVEARLIAERTLANAGLRPTREL
jgi:hypothetical protein